MRFWKKKEKESSTVEEMPTEGLDIFKEDTDSQPPPTPSRQQPKEAQSQTVSPAPVPFLSPSMPEEESTQDLLTESEPEEIDEKSEEATRPQAQGRITKDEEMAQKPTSAPGLGEGYTSEEEILKALAEQTGLPFVHIDDFESPPDELLKLVNSTLCKTYKVFPLKWQGAGILIALADPLNVRTVDDLTVFLNREVFGAIAPEEEIIQAIQEYYGAEGESIDDVFEALESQELADFKEVQDFGDLEKIANQTPIIKLVNLLLLQAIKDRASDLHIEPYENSFRIRYRVDGTLHETMPPPRNLQTAIISRLKVMAQMNIAERRMPQDGRITLSMADREIDLRVSSLPTVNGESLVMRILDKTMMKMGLEQIGLLDDSLDVFDEMIRKPNGIVLVTGPTGSGKTTTLYAALDRIYSPTLKIITTENPVEYQMDGVVQVNINQAVGLTFAACLRAILRQDPDVIMVGEIRDLETAQIAIESALTGHLVFSTLHTNDAPSAVTRLVDMDVEPFLVTSSVVGVLGQRLVRTICPNCKDVYTPKDELLLDLGMPEEDIKAATFYRGHGCVECNYTGYRGRIGIFELFQLSEAIYKMVLAREPSSTIRRQARQEGMRTLREDGWGKITMGLTTLEEVLKETL